jgi:hypothetical protein
MSAPTGNFRGQRTQSSTSGYKTIGSSIASGNNSGCFKRIFVDALVNTNNNYELAFTKTLGIPRHYYNSTSNNSNYQQPSLTGKRFEVTTDPKALSLTRVFQSATVTAPTYSPIALSSLVPEYANVGTDGTTYFLTKNYPIPSGSQLQITSGQTLYIGGGANSVTLTVSQGSSLLIDGQLYVLQGITDLGYLYNEGGPNSIVGSSVFNLSNEELLDSVGTIGAESLITANTTVINQQSYTTYTINPTFILNSNTIQYSYFVLNLSANYSGIGTPINGLWIIGDEVNTAYANSSQYPQYEYTTTDNIFPNMTINVMGLTIKGPNGISATTPAYLGIGPENMANAGSMQFLKGGVLTNSSDVFPTKVDGSIANYGVIIGTEDSFNNTIGVSFNQPIYYQTNQN